VEQLEKAVFPFIEKKRGDIGFLNDQKTLLIFDVFKGQKTERVENHFSENNCVIVFVLAT